MSVQRRRYAPLRGTQADLVRHLRRGAWLEGIPALAVALARPEANVWLAVATLDARGLIRAAKREDVVCLRLTEAGKRLRL